MKAYGILLFSFFLFFAAGCKKDDACSDELRSVEQYIEDNNLNVEEGPQGLYYIITEEGGAERPSDTAKVTVNYTGTLTNDEVFDGTPSSGLLPAIFDLERLIQGWQLGIPLVGRGGRIQLFVPSELGYGSASVGSICPNSDLIFDIELVNFVE